MKPLETLFSFYRYRCVCTMYGRSICVRTFFTRQQQIIFNCHHSLPMTFTVFFLDLLIRFLILNLINMGFLYQRLLFVFLLRLLDINYEVFARLTVVGTLQYIIQER
jgi:hypothetical protein